MSAYPRRASEKLFDKAVLGRILSIDEGWPQALRT
jgi:hypothetical protein